MKLEEVIQAYKEGKSIKVSDYDIVFNLNNNPLTFNTIEDFWKLNNPNWEIIKENIKETDK